MKVKYNLELYERQINGKLKQDYIDNESPKGTTIGDIDTLSDFFIKFIKEKEGYRGELPKNITILLQD